MIEDSWNDVTNEEVGLRLAARRHIMGLDVHALAERSQVDVETILAIEAGRHSATVNELCDLAFALGFTVTSLFREIESMER